MTVSTQSGRLCSKKLSVLSLRMPSCLCSSFWDSDVPRRTHHWTRCLPIGFGTEVPSSPSGVGDRCTVKRREDGLTIVPTAVLVVSALRVHTFASPGRRSMAAASFCSHAIAAPPCVPTPAPHSPSTLRTRPLVAAMQDARSRTADVGDGWKIFQRGETFRRDRCLMYRYRVRADEGPHPNPLPEGEGIGSRFKVGRRRHPHPGTLSRRTANQVCISCITCITK